MKTKLLITLLLTFGILASCAEFDPHPMDMNMAVQNAATKEDHEALAKHYEEVAAEMRTKANEHRELLRHYQAKSFRYGRKAQDFKAHCERLVDVYEKAAEENLEMARMHRDLAL